MKYIFTILIFSLSTLLYSQSTILEENFDAGVFPSQWTMVDNDGFTVDPSVSEYTEAWIITEDPEDASNGVASSTSFFTPVNRADRWLITPLLTLGTDNNYISWKGLSHDPSFPDSYKVMISTNSNDINDFTDTLTVVSNEYYKWTSHLYSLDEYANQDIYIAFVNTTSNGFKLYLDSVYVRENDPLSIEKEEIIVSLFPNPVVNTLHLSSGNAKIQSVKIYNSVGQMVGEKAFHNAQNVSVSTADLQSGMYVVSVETNLGVFRKRIVK